MLEEKKQVEDGNSEIRPNYYNRNGSECKDIIAAITADKTGLEAFVLGNVIKYLWRYREKNGIEDIRKAETYIKMLRLELENENANKQ